MCAMTKTAAISVAGALVLAAFFRLLDFPSFIAIALISLMLCVGQVLYLGWFGDRPRR